MYGQSIQNEAISHSFLYDHINNSWMELGLFNDSATHTYYKYTCAPLRPENHVVVISEDNCKALNLTSLTWNNIKLPLKNGIVFNRDSHEF